MHAHTGAAVPVQESSLTAAHRLVCFALPFTLDSMGTFLRFLLGTLL